MAVIRTVAQLAHETASTALSAARHPVSTTAHGVGLAKGTLAYGLGVVRGNPPAQRRPEEATTSVATAPVATPEPSTTPERDLPGPDLAVAAVPEIDELPEPIVIEADDAVGEAFHNEPKAASRDSEHGDAPADLEEITTYVEEPQAEGEDTLVWTSESDLTAPTSAEAEPTQAETEPLRLTAQPPQE